MSAGSADRYRRHQRVRCHPDRRRGAGPDPSAGAQRRGWRAGVGVAGGEGGGRGDLAAAAVEMQQQLLARRRTGDRGREVHGRGLPAWQCPHPKSVGDRDQVGGLHVMLRSLAPASAHDHRRWVAWAGATAFRSPLVRCRSATLTPERPQTVASRCRPGDARTWRPPPNSASSSPGISQPTHPIHATEPGELQFGSGRGRLWKRSGRGARCWSPPT